MPWNVVAPSSAMHENEMKKNVAFWNGMLNVNFVSEGKTPNGVIRDPMDTVKTVEVKLLALTPIDVKDELDEKLERCYVYVQNLIGNSSEKDAHDILSSTVCKSATSHEEVSLGLLVGILTDTAKASMYYRSLTYVSRDGFALVVNCLNSLILEKYLKLSEVTRTQLLWILKEMIKGSIVGIDALCFNLLRQISGGDISPKNVWLAENMLDIFIEHRTWLENVPFLIATVVYTYLRLIIDHGSPHLSNLRQKEIEYCISMLREKFSECMIIGRDLVRLLQNVARVPEFEKFWKDLYNNPSTLAPGFTGVEQLMNMRTSRRFLQCRLTPDMERKIVFLASSVRFGQQKRYQDWFQRFYLATPESQTLRCDLIRFICGVIHPSNEVLCSDIIPRWAIIGWLLTTCTSNVAASNAKLSLFYDWLLYDSERDNIMNIEPAILVMYHSMRSHPAITATLLDFLCRITQNFCPSMAGLVKKGIRSSLQQILEKRVLQSLLPLFDSPKLDRELKAMIRESFPEFCSTSKENDSSSTIPANNFDNDSHVNNKAIRDIEVSIIDEKPANHHNIMPQLTNAKFSDDDEETLSRRSKNIKDVFKNDNKDINKLEVQTCLYSLPKIDLPVQIEQCGGDEIKRQLLCLQQEKDNEIRCEIMEKLLQEVLQEEDIDQDSASNLALCLLYILQDDFLRKVFPGPLCDEDALEDSIGTPLFVMFRNLCQTPKEDPCRIPLLTLLAEMATNQPRIGYLLLYFLKVGKMQDTKMSAYRDYVRTLGKDLTSALLFDLRTCLDEDVNLFCYLIPETYTQFSNIAIGSAELLNMVVSCVDSNQMRDLVCHILQGNLKMFMKDSIVSILNASIQWETFEQVCLWQLISAHNTPIENVISILPKLEFQEHAEAMTNILLLLQREVPNANLLKHLFNREVKENDDFVASVLNYWMQKDEERLGDLINSFITSKLSSPSKRKRNTNNKSVISGNVEQILGHLDQLRQKLDSKQLKIFNKDSMQNALVHVQSLATDSQKTKYSDLLALAEELEQKPQKRGKNSKAKTKSINIQDSETESEDSEDGNPPTKQTKNSRKKRKAVASDSD